MDTKLLLIKCATLLYRESQSPHHADSSVGLVRTVLENARMPEVGIGLNSERTIVSAIRDTVLEMCGNPSDYDYDKSELLQRIKLNCCDDEALYNTIASGFEEDLTDNQLKRSIISIRRSIGNHFQEEQIGMALMKAANKFRFQREKIGNVSDFVNNHIAELEPLRMLNNGKDPAIIRELDIGNEEEVAQAFDRVHIANDNTGILKLGWTRLNKMLQGGFRRGEAWMINALQHKYKTGFSLTLFKQIALNNKPTLFDVNRKPLLLRISFEDDVEANLQFLYQSLIYDETGVMPDVRSISSKEMASVVKERLQVNGFHIKMLRVDPTNWTYSHICSKVIEYESQGYEVILLMLDYLSKIPTTGCNNTGAAGTDQRDLVRRMRNFCNAGRKTTFITPHQMSSDAKQLLRNNIAEDQLVKEVNEKGYTEGSKQLDQEYDGIIHMHLFKYMKRTYLAFQRDRHRIPTILPDEHKYFIKQFPEKGAPIPDDTEDDDRSYSKITEVTAKETSELFAF